MNIFVLQLFNQPGFFFTVIAAVGFSVCVHEFFHAYVALKCGDPTAANCGHLTLNPLKQMGTMSIFMLLLLGFCWGAVPVNPYNLTRRGRVAVSLAGPGANLGLFIVGVIAFLLAGKLDLKFILTPAVIFCQLNLVLFAINMMPVPGFDGAAVLSEFLPMNKLYGSEVGKGFMLGAIILFFYLVDYIFLWANRITGWVLEFCWSIVS